MSVRWWRGSAPSGFGSSHRVFFQYGAGRPLPLGDLPLGEVIPPLPLVGLWYWSPWVEWLWLVLGFRIARLCRAAFSSCCGVYWYRVKSSWPSARNLASARSRSSCMFWQSQCSNLGTYSSTCMPNVIGNRSVGDHRMLRGGLVICSSSLCFS